MITACELCAKITVETAMREEAIRIAKAKTAKAFAEEVISPILEKLTEIPNHLEIGFRYHDPSARGLFCGIGGWQLSTTTRGNPMRIRNFIEEIRGESDYTMLDYEILNQYLAEFGFQISTELKWITTVEYSTSTKNRGDYVDYLYLSMTCPMEDF